MMFNTPTGPQNERQVLWQVGLSPVAGQDSNLE